MLDGHGRLRLTVGGPTLPYTVPFFLGGINKGRGDGVGWGRGMGGGGLRVVTVRIRRCIDLFRRRTCLRTNNLDFV